MKGVVPPCQNPRKIVDSAIFRFLPSLRGGRDRGRGEAPSRVKGMGDVRKNYVSRKGMNRCIIRALGKFPNKGMEFKINPRRRRIKNERRRPALPLEPLDKGRL